MRGRWPAGTLVSRQLTRHAYPGQASTRHEDNHGICRRVIATGFRIHPACPHHGHLASTHLQQRMRHVGLTIEQLWNDPYLNVLRDPYDLDDNERKD